MVWFVLDLKISRVSGLNQEFFLLINTNICINDVTIRTVISKIWVGKTGRKVIAMTNFLLF